ncbi:MAG TPA: regulator, partial [Candidatus Limnocylindria bacterium]|nr:regulator [Candidatus Limnocylindria bacterium]
MNQTYAARWWVAGDWNAFLGLFANIVANMLVAASLLLFVVRIPANIVFGQIMPALGIAVFLGNLYYAYMARRTSIREGRRATALPYGPSVGHLFVVTFLIILPVFRSTNNATLAWLVGAAWCAVESLTEIVGSFVGPWVRRNTPRAAMLAVMAGIAITLIGMGAAFRVWEAPYIGLVTLAFVLIAWTGRTRLPGNIPAALALLVVGTVIAWVGTWVGLIPAPQQMSAQAVTSATSGLRLAIPGVNLTLEGFTALVPFLAIAIPLGIGGFLNTMDNVESAAAAGDEFDTREAMLADGGASLVGSVFGSPFATGVFVGQPGWKEMGAGFGYTAATGIAVLLVSVLGILSLFQAIIPIVAVIPILLYIALVMGAQAFQAVPARHAPAVVIALLPWLASWAKQQVDGALTAAGTNAVQVGIDKLAGQNVLYNGLAALEQGVLLTSMILGAMTAFIIERRYRAAGIVALIAAAFSFVGLMHSPSIGIFANGWALGYLVLAAIIYGAGLLAP